MDEDGNDDANVWNASAVILDIDSGVLNARFNHIYIKWQQLIQKWLF